MLSLFKMGRYRLLVHLQFNAGACLLASDLGVASFTSLHALHELSAVVSLPLLPYPFETPDLASSASLLPSIDAGRTNMMAIQSRLTAKQRPSRPLVSAPPIFKVRGSQSSDLKS